MWYFDGMRWLTIGWFCLNVYGFHIYASLDPSIDEMLAWNKLRGRTNCIEKIPEPPPPKPEREY